MKHFPFTSSFDLKMGTAPMKEHDALIEADEHYSAEVELKRNLLKEDHSYYYNSLDGNDVAQWDVVEKVIDDLVKHDPENFLVHKNDSGQWHWENKRLGESFTFTFGDNTSLSIAPLDWIGRQVQEDLIILNTAGEVVGGQLCFPSGWALHEKIGKQFMEVHAPLPSVIDPMIQAANKLMERIPMNKPISRNNWGFRLGNQLDMSSKYSLAYRKKLREEAPDLTMDSFGEKIFLRVEHQTLTRLPRSGYILFTIHTYHTPLREVVENRERADVMVSFLKTVPVKLLEHKVIDPYYDKLISYLERSISR